MFQIDGGNFNGETLQQFFSSFKGTIAWNQPTVERIYTAYLELIPVKPEYIEIHHYMR